MTIANLPPSNHIGSLRMFLSRMRRTRSIPSAQEIAHAEESLREIEKALNLSQPATT